MQKILLSFLLVALFVQCKRNKEMSASKPAKESSVRPTIDAVSEIYDSFGVDLQNLKMADFSVKKNESLYLLLQKLDLSQKQIYRTIQKAKKVIDFNAFRPHQSYRTYVSKKNGKLQKLIWEPNDVDYVTFDWQQDSLQVYRASRVVTQKTKTIRGTINSSLYNAISDTKARDELVYELSNILAWQVNFFNLRKGDQFKIVYKNKYVEDNYFDTGNILAVELTNMGDTYYAYRFKEGDIDNYYDEKGKSVKNALLKTPFKYDERISSRYNMHRMHPILHRRMPHTGVDFAAPYGTPVLAVGNGIVLEAHYGGAAGNIIKIRHNKTFKTAYMHLSKFANGVHRGAHVKQGEVIAYVGNTGRVTGTHLHYSMYKNNRPVNPLKVKLPASKSLPQKYMPDFKARRDALNKMLFSKKKSDSAGINAATVQ